MNKIKAGVTLYGIKPEMVLINCVVSSVFAKFHLDCIITSGVGKKHSDRSLHYPGFALDYRAKHIPSREMQRKVLDELKNALPQCDIVLEYVGEPQSHYHVEFDPKDDGEFQENKLYYRKHGKWPV